jgi:PAS domain S-box-containing protein
MSAPELITESAEELYEGAPCGYLSFSPEGTLLRVNRTLLAWTGYDREELLDGRRLQDLLTTGGKAYFETHVGPLLQMQGAVQEIQLELVCAAGQTLPVLLNAVLRRNPAGLPELFTGMVFNITDRKRYERELVLARRSAEQRARYAAMGAQVGRALARRLDSGAQLVACADALVEHFDALEVRIWSCSKQSIPLRLEASAGVFSADPTLRLERAPAREARACGDRRPGFFRRPTAAILSMSPASRHSRRWPTSWRWRWTGPTRSASEICSWGSFSFRQRSCARAASCSRSPCAASAMA